MKKTVSLLIILLIGTFSIAQETFPVNETTNPNHTIYAFINAKIIVDADETLDNATMLVKDGIITVVGTKVSIPKGSVIYDLKGKSIYPAFIDAYTNYGMPEIKVIPRNPFPQMGNNTKGAYGWNHAVKAEMEAYKNFNSNSGSADEFRKLGFGAVLTFQKDGIVRGSGAVVSLADGNENSLIINNKAAAMYSFDKGSSTQDYPSSLMGAIALLRQTYLDADLYKKQTPLSLRRGAGGEVNISLEAFNKLQMLPQIIETTNKFDALRANKIAKEFKVNYIIKGSGTEYQCLDEIKASNCKFIIPINFPVGINVDNTFDTTNASLAALKHWEMAPANLLAMGKYYIPFAITTADLKDKNDFWKNLRKAISYGFSEKQALKSLTSIPAEMLKVSDKIGKLKKGMIANFIITSGNLFDEQTIIYENWIQGNAYKINDSSKPVEKKDSLKKVAVIKYGQVIYPFCAYGKPLDDRDGFNKIVNNFKTRYDAILIKHVTVWTNEAEGILKNQDVYITEGRIVRIADDIRAPKLAFAKVIDGTGKHLTAGIIDEHSHIAIANDAKETTTVSSPEMRIMDVINPEDTLIYKHLSEGVTTVQIVDSSAHSSSIQNAVIKLRWGKSVDEMKFTKAVASVKQVLNYNSVEKLNLQAVKLVSEQKIAEEDALKTITILPAIALQIGKKVGSIKVSKDADVVLWSDNPLSINAKVEMTIIDGLIYYDSNEDLKLRKDIQKERTRIIQKMLDEKK